MKANTIFSLLLMSSVILVFGCKQSTSSSDSTQGVWVEITDTTHLPDIHGMSSVYSKWQEFSGLTVSDTNSFKNLASMIDTSIASGNRDIYHKYPLVLPNPPNFSQYSMVGLLYYGSIDDTYRSTLYVNDGLKQYHYSVWCTNPHIIKRDALLITQNWLLVPRLKEGYTVIIDTIQASNH